MVKKNFLAVHVNWNGNSGVGTIFWASVSIKTINNLENSRTRNSSKKILKPKIPKNWGEISEPKIHPRKILESKIRQKKSKARKIPGNQRENFYLNQKFVQKKF